MPNDSITRSLSGNPSLRENASIPHDGLHRTLESSGMIAVILDAGGCVLFINKKGCDALGLPEAEIVGQKWADRFLPDSAKEEFNRRFHETLSGECRISGLDESPVLTHTGEERIVGWHRPLIRDGSGRAPSVVLTGEDVTPRVEIEEALLESEARYRTLAEMLPDGIVLHTGGIIVLANEAAVRLAGGRRPEDLVGKPVMEFVHPDFRPVIAEQIRHLLDRPAKVELIEQKFIRLDGTAVDVDVASVSSQYRGKPAILTMVRDSTQAKLIREALEDSERRFHALLEHAPDGMNIFEVDLQNGKRKLVFCNDRYVEMSGFTRVELLTRADHIDDLLEVYSREGKMPATPAESYRSGSPQSGTCSWKRPDGRENYFEYTTVPMLIDGRPHLIGIDRDITERRRNETALQFTQFAVDHSAEAAFWMDPDGRLVYVNEAACRSLAYSRKELLKLSVNDIDPDFPIERWRTHWYDVKRRGHFIIESRHKRKDRTIFPVEIQVNFVEFGGREYNCAFVRDISLRKEMEARIQADIREKEVMLKEIHHRVKNNMQVISSLLHLQSSFIRDESSRRMFHESQSRIRSMAMVHEQLYQTKDFAGIEFGRYVENLTKELMVTFGSHAMGIELKSEIPSFMLDVNEAIPCGLIVNELVTNALKHAFPEGWGEEGTAKPEEKRILIRITPLKSGFWNLTVKDNGIGIPGDFNIRETESLGMKIVIALVDQMGGAIKVDGRKGSEFSVTLKKNPPAES
jgi:PAS domain S-box-containing protein